MPDNATNAPLQKATPSRSLVSGEWRPFLVLRREIDRLFEDFDRGPWGAQLGRSMYDWPPRWLSDSPPAVEVAEKDTAYEITVELPGLDQNNIDVKLAGGALTIKGEKKEETEEKRKNYYMSERRFGSFERSFQLPEDVDQDKIGASFNKGVLTITLPKSAQAQKSTKKIEVKTA
jgi:HSP20 family protein